MARAESSRCERCDRERGPLGADDDAWRREPGLCWYGLSGGGSVGDIVCLVQAVNWRARALAAIDSPDRPCSGCGDMVSGDPVCGACWRRTFPEASALADERRKTIAEVTALLRGPADPGGTRPIGWARWSRREMADAIERAFADEVKRV